MANRDKQIEWLAKIGIYLETKQHTKTHNNLPLNTQNKLAEAKQCITEAINSLK